MFFHTGAPGGTMVDSGSVTGVTVIELLDGADNSRISNSGRIDGTSRGIKIETGVDGVFVSNDGVIAGASSGVLSSAAGTVVHNSRTISAPSDGAAGALHGVDPHFVNTGDVVGDSDAVTFFEAGTIVNRGTINANELGLGLFSFTDLTSPSARSFRATARIC